MSGKDLHDDRGKRDKRVSESVQHHYLPKEAHLRFFEDPRRPGFIWMYQRDSSPVQVNLEKAARERHLYSFATDDGALSDRIERELAALEEQTLPILTKITQAPGNVTITAEEEYVLAWFAACQAMRTPSQRRVVQELMGGLGRTMALATAMDRETFRRQLDKAKSAGAIPQDTDADHLREYILAGNYTVVGSERPAMLFSLDAADDLVPTFLMKRLAVVRSAEVVFITSDYPVLRYPQPGTPRMYSGGFLSSFVFLSIGRHTSLYWIPDDNKEPASSPQDKTTLISTTQGGSMVRGATKDIMAASERFLFSSERNDDVARLFSQTTRPDRVSFSSPFDRLVEQQRRKAQ